MPGSPQKAGTTDEARSIAAGSVTGMGAPPAATRAFVLDDELRIAAMVGKVLEAGGFAARTFTAIPQFLAELKNDEPELLVLDLSLGEPAVVEIVYKLEADGYRGKVLLISGRDETMLYEISQIGANHGLSMLPPLKKPFRPADVRQRFLAGQTVWTAEPTPPLADRLYRTAS
jgi:DNA-binding response OmpR family regulator